MKSECGNKTVLRALIDPRSQGCLIFEKAVQLLKSKKRPAKDTVLGVGSTKSMVSPVVQVQVISKWRSNFNLQIIAYVSPKQLTTQIPTQRISSYNWSHLKELTLDIEEIPDAEIDTDAVYLSNHAVVREEKKNN